MYVYVWYECGSLQKQAFWILWTKLSGYELLMCRVWGAARSQSSGYCSAISVVPKSVLSLALRICFVLAFYEIQSG